VSVFEAKIHRRDAEAAETAQRKLKLEHYSLTDQDSKLIEKDLGVKRCPTCNQTFEEEWLSFCTQDGTTLMEEAPGEPPPPASTPPAATPSSRNEQVTWNLPSSGGAPADVKPRQLAWQPPPPPLYATAPNKSLGVAAMILGIISVTVGWMCFGPIPGIVAIILGGVALSQIKKNPDRVSGKQFAWVGMITGSLTLVIYAIVMVIYVIAMIMGASASR